MSVAGVILAAGASRRMGRDKRRLVWEGETLAARAARAALEGGLSPILAVVGPDGLEGLPDGVTRVVNSDPARGMGSSLAAGLAALPTQAGAVVVLLADMPLVEGRHVKALVQAFQQDDTIVVPVHGGRRGNPVLIGRRWFHQLLQLTGDTGARAVIRDNPDRVIEVEMDDAVLKDFDTPEDWERSA